MLLRSYKSLSLVLSKRSSGPTTVNRLPLNMSRSNYFIQQVELMIQLGVLINLGDSHVLDLPVIEDSLYHL